MEQSYEEVLGQLLMRFANGVDAAVEFSKEQIPDLIQQLLMWKMSWAFVWLIIGIAWSVYIMYLMYRGYKRGPDPSDSHGDMVWDFCWRWVFLIVGIIIVLCNLHDILMINFAPKLYVLEYASDLLNPPEK